MNDLTDQQLLRDYAERRTEPAFAELVRRHVDFVYSAALRMVRDAHFAEDVTQGVFVTLAANAQQLIDHPVLAGWLHRTAQNLAANTVRSDVRRRAREHEAATMNELLSADSAAVWEHIAPHLDAALDELGESDRDALLLRYFQNKSAREMAQILNTTEDAAQKRVSRAVERLRELFVKRGVTVGASGLVVVISANAVQAAPACLAATISSAAVLTGATVAATTTTATITKAIAMTTLQKTLIVATIAVTASAGFYEAHQASTLREQAQTFQEQIQALQQQAPLAASSNKAALSALQNKIDLLATQNAELTNALAQANADKARLETEREQARHSAALFKELADQASPSDKNSTNDYPTARHIMAGWGRLGRLSAKLSKDESNLSEEEKTANEAARLNALGEIGNLMKAMKQLEMNKPPGSDSPMGDDPADSGACLLYGALNLNEQQFNDVYGVLDRYRQQAKQDNLLETNAAPETAAALKKLTEQAMADIRSALTPEQARIFEDISPYIHVGPGKFNFSFNFAEKK